MAHEDDGNEASLLDIDPDLNIFALANGMDLLKNRSGRPERTLEWYREGMERRIGIEADEEKGSLRIWVGATRKKEGRRWEARREVENGVTLADFRAKLRDGLSDCVDEANHLTRDDLSPVDGNADS